MLWWSEDDPRYQYLLDVARRLERVGLANLTEYDAMVLMAVLAHRSIKFADGIVLDALFIAEAAGIVASLARVPEQDWQWYKVHFPSYPPCGNRNKNDDKYALYGKDQNALMERLAAHGVVFD